MCLELNLDSFTLYLISKRFDASRSQPAVIVIGLQTLRQKLQDLQAGGRLEVVHCRKIHLGRKVLIWTVVTVKKSWQQLLCVKAITGALL